MKVNQVAHPAACATEVLRRTAHRYYSLALESVSATIRWLVPGVPLDDTLDRVLLQPENAGCPTAAINNAVTFEEEMKWSASAYHHAGGRCLLLLLVGLLHRVRGRCGLQRPGSYLI